MRTSIIVLLYVALKMHFKVLFHLDEMCFMLFGLVLAICQDIRQIQREN